MNIKNEWERGVEAIETVKQKVGKISEDENWNAL